MYKNKKQKLGDSSDSDDDETSKFADAVDPVLHAKLYAASSNGETKIPSH